MKKIFILVGPKGSGKSYIGHLLAQHYELDFFHIENVWLSLQANEPMHYSTITCAIEEKLNNTNILMFEQTGAWHDFSTLLEDLSRKYELHLIRVSAPVEVCLQRIQLRDQSIHIAVTKESIQKINQKSSQLSLPFELIFENTTAQDIDLLEQFSKVYPNIKKRFISHGS